MQIIYPWAVYFKNTAAFIRRGKDLYAWDVDLSQEKKILEFGA